MDFDCGLLDFENNGRADGGGKKSLEKALGTKGLYSISSNLLF